MQQSDQVPSVANPYAATLASAIDAPLVDDDGFATAEFKPFQTIWAHPRRTIRRIVAENPRRHVVLLAMLAGVEHMLDTASSRGLGEQLSLGTIIAAACVFGPFLGLVGLWIISLAIQITGRSLGGVGNGGHIRAAVAWALVPHVCVLALWIPLILLVGPDMFTVETPRLDAQPLLFIPLLATAVAQLVLGIWGLVILCHTVAEVQGYRSSWRGLGNLVVAAVVGFVLLLILIICLVILLMSIPRSL